MLIHSELDRYVKIECRLKAGVEENNELLLASLYSSGFNAFEEINSGIIGYCSLDELNNELVEKEVIQNPHFSDNWEFKQEIIYSENWNEEWEKNFPPVIINEKCRVKAEFHDPEPGFKYEITIHPRMAFGTGHHETTALMIKQILDTPLEGKKVLDVGCGTAILSILCSLKGAAEIIGLDNDINAIDSAGENIKLNHTENIRLIEGELSDISESDFDLLLANINLNYITRHIGKFARVVRSGGVIICSGFFNSELARLETAIPADLLTLDHTKVENKWIVCIYRKN